MTVAPRNFRAEDVTAALKAALPESIVRLEGLKTLRLQANPWGGFPEGQENWLRGLAARGVRIRR